MREDVHSYYHKGNRSRGRPRGGNRTEHQAMIHSYSFSPPQTTFFSTAVATIDTTLLAVQVSKSATN